MAFALLLADVSYLHAAPIPKNTSVKSNSKVFPKNAELELLFTRQAPIQGGLTEGPAADPNGIIYFTDIPEGKDDGMILTFDPRTGETMVFSHDSRKSNGLEFARDGSLIACSGADGGSRALLRWDTKTGEYEVLADRFQGRRFNAPNDLIIDRLGRIYFTDPHYVGNEPRELERESVYRWQPDGTVIEVTREVEKPNGIALSADERTLYVVDHNSGTPRSRPDDPEPQPGAMAVYAFPLDEQGLVCGPRKTLVDFTPEKSADGITTDSQGRIYLTCRSLARPGIMVIDDEGLEIDFLPTGPANQPPNPQLWKGMPSNVEFGVNEDAHTLYITIDRSLYRVQTNATGRQRYFAAQ